MPTKTRPTRATPLSAPERRAAIIAATIPLLRTRGTAVTTRQIAEAAGVAEGTIFSVFPDKDALLMQAVDAALDPAPVAARLAQVDLTLPLRARLVAAVGIIQAQIIDVWQLLTAIPPDPRRPIRVERQRLLDPELLASLFEPSRVELDRDPVVAGQALLALAMAGSNPFVFPNPMSPDEIVTLLLKGVQR